MARRWVLSLPHQIQLLQAKAGMEIGALPDDNAAEYVNEWNEFQTFRQNAINLVNSWDKWE